MLCVHSSKWMDEFSMSTSTSTSNGSHGIVGISNMDISASTATAATVYEWTISTSSLAMNTHLSHAWMCEKLCIPRICIMQTRPKMKVVRGFLLSLSLSLLLPLFLGCVVGWCFCYRSSRHKNYYRLLSVRMYILVWHIYVLLLEMLAFRSVFV